MPRVFCAILGVAAFALAGPVGAAPTPSLQAAAAAYFRMQVPQAEVMFRQILADPAAPVRDRAGAALGLARIQWLIDLDRASAEATLEAGRAPGADLCPNAIMAARILREAGEPEVAADAARAHMADCPGAAQRDQLTIEEAKDELAFAPDQGGGTAALKRSRAALESLSNLSSLSPPAAALKLELALQTSDARGALEAWRSFFWLTERNAPQSFGLADAQVARRFSDGLSGHARLADQIALERLLVRGGFYDAVRRFDASQRIAARAGSISSYRPVKAYLEFRSGFDAATTSFNRAWARGHGDENAYRAAVAALLERAAVQLGGGEPKKVLRAAWGVHWIEGKTGGVESVHMGHVVEDAPLTVAQFGRKGQVRFVSIDNLESNGAQSWLWDGLAATGGWSEGDNDIVQVRASLTRSPLIALASFDPEIAANRRRALADAEIRDREALKDAAGPVYLPALEIRLATQGRERLAAAVRAEAAQSRQSFDRLFLKTYWEAALHDSIQVHEGRHALDHQEYKGSAALDGPELEYRAKLSELELGRMPRISLAAILSADLGSDTNHGKADARIMQELSDWIAAHGSEIQGYDPAVPAAEQIDRLSDDQLRAIARTLDPELHKAGAAPHPPA